MKSIFALAALSNGIIGMTSTSPIAPVNGVVSLVCSLVFCGLVVRMIVRDIRREMK